MINKRFITIIVLIQIIVISILSYIMYRKFKNSLANISINPIKKESIILSKSSALKSFYEPKANATTFDDEWWNPNKAKHTINKDTLNERFEYSIDKPKNTYRIITLGDSFTFGQLVDTSDSWPEQLEDSLNTKGCKNHFEVINLGVAGYDIQYAVERYKIRGSKYRPDLVMWFLKSDDFDDVNEFVYTKAQFYKKETQKTDEFKKNIAKGNYYFWWDMARRDLANIFSTEKLLALQANYLDSLNNYYKGPLLIFTFPNMFQKYRTVIDNSINKRQNSHFFENVSNIYQNEDLFFPDKHPNQKGHKVIAQDLYGYLTKNKLIPCE